jgi:predicted SAM-dependent methyltransferase
MEKCFCGIYGEMFFNACIYCRTVMISEFITSVLLRGRVFRCSNSSMLNLGCGIHFNPSWDNYDFVASPPEVKKVDLSRTLPFGVSSYEVCYISHVLEHLPRQRVPSLFEEMFRTLKPRGVLRVVVPDLEAIARLYLAELEAAVSGDPEAADRHEWMTLELFDQMTRSFTGGFMGRTMRSRPLPHRSFIESRIGWEGKNWLSAIDDASNSKSSVIARNKIYEIQSIGSEAESNFRQSGEVHRWMYDRVSLGRLLQASGFTDVRVCQADESRIAKFVSYRLDTDETGAVRKPDSLFIEASKPN